jgi:HK97 family phage prohead protease
MSMHRAYAVMTVKAMDEKKRTFTGVATTPSTDRMGDIVEPKGMEFKLPLPLLWQHDSSNPIGWVRKAKVTSDGIEVECEVANVDDEGPLKQRLAEYWQMLKSGLVRGLSIGFNALESARIEGTYGYRFMRTLWLELSAVTIAANQDCSIHTIKSLSEQHLAARGREGSPPGSPGASGQQQQAASGRHFSSRSLKGTTMKTLKDLLEQQETRLARQTEITKAWGDPAHERTDEERAELDAIDKDLVTLGDDIRIARMNARHAANAKGVDGSGSEAAAASRGGMSFVRKQDPDDKFKGQAFTRLLIARAASFVAMKNGNFVSPADVAAHRWGKTHPKLVEYVRAAVAGGGTGSGEWGAELAQSDARYTGDFVEFLYAMTVFDKLPLREVPARIHIKGQDGAASANWVGESRAIPVSKPDFSDVELTPLKVAAIAVCSKELVADSSPSAEMWIRDSLGQAQAQKVDSTFFSTAAASAGISPAGIGNGLSAASPSGTDAAAVRADLMTLYLGFLAAKNASGLVQVMTPSMAKAISLLMNALGQKEFPGLKATGGELEGDTVFTGDNIAGGDWWLLKPSDIWKIGDSGVDVSMTDQATIEQNDAPQGEGDTPTAASATLMSLWQTEQIGFKVTRRINFQKRRTSAVALLQNGEYGGVAS